VVTVQKLDGMLGRSIRGITMKLSRAEFKRRLERLVGRSSHKSHKARTHEAQIKCVTIMTQMLSVVFKRGDMKGALGDSRQSVTEDLRLLGDIRYQDAHQRSLLVVHSCAMPESR